MTCKVLLHVMTLTLTLLVSLTWIPFSFAVDSETFDYFPNRLERNVGQTPEELKLVDLNNDGKKDIVITESETNSLIIYFQNEEGSFEEKTIIPTLGIATRTFDAGDLNNDGLVDIAVASTEQFDESGVSAVAIIEIFYQDENGVFNFGLKINDAKALVIRCGDVNNDGLDDIIGSDGYDLVEYIQQENKEFVEQGIFGVGGRITDVKISDFYGDNFNQIIVMKPQRFGCITLSGHDGFDFVSPNEVLDLASDSESGHSFEIGDLNNDGLADIAVSVDNYENLPQIEHFLVIFYQNTNHSFSEPVYYPLSSRVVPLSIGDLNQDGLNDIAMIHVDPVNKLGILFQGEGGSLSSELFYDIPDHGLYRKNVIEIGDLNNDDSMDVALVGYSYDPNQSLVIFLNAFNPSKLSISANGKKDFLKVNEGDQVEVKVSINGRGFEGEFQDLWVGSLTPFGTFWYQKNGGNPKWVQSVDPLEFSSDAIVSVDDLPVLDIETLPAGLYQMFIAMDYNEDGSLDGDLFELVNVLIK